MFGLSTLPCLIFLFAVVLFKVGRIDTDGVMSDRSTHSGEMFETAEAMCEINEVLDAEANEVMDVAVDIEEAFGRSIRRSK